MAGRKPKPLPPGFYRRKGIIYVRTDPVTGRALSTRCRDVQAAQMFYAERERLSVHPAHAAADQATVGDWIKRTLKSKAKTRSDGTMNMYHVKLGHVARIIGEKTKMRMVDAGAVDRYIHQRQEEGAKNNTIARELTCLWQMLKLARRAGEYPFELSQVKPVDFSADYEPVERFLEPDDLPKLLAVCRPEEQAWICFALATGGDITDVEAALPGDYDPALGVIKMRGTKNKFRKAKIPVPDELVGLLEFALPHLPLSWPRVSKALPERCDKAGIPRVSPKDLRRSAGTWLQEAGVRIDTLAKFMRHSGAKVTHDVYARGRAEKIRHQIQRQTQGQIRYTISGPLAKSADAEDLKSSAQTAELTKPAKKLRKASPRNTTKHVAADAELLQAAQGRARKFAALSGVDPSFETARLIHESVAEAYYMSEGDPDAEANIRKNIDAVAENLGLVATAKS